MTALAAEFFTLDEVNRLKIIQDVIDRRLTTQMAAHRLGISDRQCRRLLARYREDEELRLNGVSLPYSTYDKLSEIDQGAIVDNKRLGRALEMAQLVQAERDNNRSHPFHPATVLHAGVKPPTTKKSQRSLDQDDMLNALVKLQSRSEEIFGKKQT